jgi:histidine triad (HIT) family protein
MKTLFEKIIDREIPADIVYEDEICLAFLDIHPQSKGHTLLITRTPFGRIEFVSDSEINHCMHVSKKIIKIMKQNLLCDYVQIEIVGKGIPEHFHIHLIPRMESDHIPESPYQEYSDIEKQEYISRLKNSL